MSLAQRVKDHRYAKGWGPDELAARAEISRTALYQIESGRTELPRAGTLQRIAAALDLSTDDLLAPVSVPTLPVITGRWLGQTNPMPTPVTSAVTDMDASARFQYDPAESHRDLDRKFRELLASPLGESVARIVEESYRILPRMMRSAW